MKSEDLIKELNKYADDQRAVHSSRFFKSGKGEYGEGDVFIGVRVPDTRKVCREFRKLSLAEVQKLLDSPIHEHRLAAVIILSDQFKNNQKEIYEFYLNNVYEGRINNWDIVDSSARKIMGPYLFNKPRDILFKLASNDDIWQRRVAVISTFYFISHGDASTAIELAEKLLKDDHDLIHKAVGWMLREVGGRVDEGILLDFLNTNAVQMPRTMLRYSIEKLPESKRKYYLNLS